MDQKQRNPRDTAPLIFNAKWLIDFTLSNTRRFYSSKGDPLDTKGLKKKYLF